ncbi:MAG: hypothetical protein KJ571_01225 [Bacteroidetes bacterium]|nr:hypothetical protein [Bacteroidota bacterium]
MENKKNINFLPNKLRNYIPFAAIFVLTAGLLFYFKENKQSVNDFIESGKNNLISFYTQNLKPILFKTDISNEDVFNFALYQNLPIDKKENKILQIGYDKTNSSEYFEIKPAEINENTQNYKKFSEYLKLDGKQQQQLDSVLESYKDALYTSVLYNDYNAIAVDSKITLLREAVFADLMAFAQNINSEEFEKAVSKDYKYNTSEIRNAIKDIKEFKENDLNDFVIFTPDSIFKTEFRIDKKKFKKEMNALNWDLKRVRSELKDIDFKIKINPMVEFDKEKLLSENSEIKPDSNYYKAFLSEDFLMNRMKDFVDVKKLRNNIEKLNSDIEKIKINVNTSHADKSFIELKNIINAGSKGELVFDLNLKGLDSLIEKSVNRFEMEDIKDWEEFGFKMDSLANSLQFNFSDSVHVKFDKEKLKKEIQKAKSELNRRKNN